MILLDTDVLLDVALDRAPHAEPAAELLTRLERGNRRGFIAWHSLSNFYHLVTPSRGKNEAKGFLSDLTRFVLVAPTDIEAFHYAAGLPLADFEDALQVAAAVACGASFIATRNLRDFRRSPVPARTPAELVEALE